MRILLTQNLSGIRASHFSLEISLVLLGSGGSWAGERRREWHYQLININVSRVMLLAGRIRSLDISVAAFVSGYNPHCRMELLPLSHQRIVSWTRV